MILFIYSYLCILFVFPKGGGPVGSWIPNSLPCTKTFCATLKTSTAFSDVPPVSLHILIILVTFVLISSSDVSSNSMTSGELEGGKLSSSLLFLSTSSTMVVSMKSQNNPKAVDNILFKIL